MPPCPFSLQPDNFYVTFSLHRHFHISNTPTAKPWDFHACAHMHKNPVQKAAGETGENFCASAVLVHLIARTFSTERHSFSNKHSASLQRHSIGPDTRKKMRRRKKTTQVKSHRQYMYTYMRVSHMCNCNTTEASQRVRPNDSTNYSQNCLLYQQYTTPRRTVPNRTHSGRLVRAPNNESACTRFICGSLLTGMSFQPAGMCHAWVSVSVHAWPLIVGLRHKPIRNTI